MPHQSQTSIPNRIVTFLGNVIFVMLFPVALFVVLVMTLLMPVVEIVLDAWEDVWGYWAAEFRESRRLRTPLEEREGRLAKNLGMWCGIASGDISRKPHNERLREEAPTIIRDALARGLVVKAPCWCFYTETRFIEWISDDDKRVIAYRYQGGKGEFDRDTFRLSSFCYQREECTPEGIFVPVERSRPTASGENKDK